MRSAWRASFAAVCSWHLAVAEASSLSRAASVSCCSIRNAAEGGSRGGLPSAEPTVSRGQQSAAAPPQPPAAASPPLWRRRLSPSRTKVRPSKSRREEEAEADLVELDIQACRALLQTLLGGDQLLLRRRLLQDAGFQRLELFRHLRYSLRRVRAARHEPRERRACACSFHIC